MEYQVGVKAAEVVAVQRDEELVLAVEVATCTESRSICTWGNYDKLNL